MAKAAKIGDIYVAINARLDKFEKDLKKAQQVSKKSAGMIQRGFDKLNLKKARHNILSFNRLWLSVAAGWGAKRIAQSFIEIGASFEQLQVKLEVLNRGRGQQIFEELNRWALEMPISTKEAINSFTMMQAMGLDPTIAKMQTLVDVGTVLGEDTLTRVSMQLGQTASMGKLLGQEIRVLGEAGINARRYLKEAFGMTVEEVQKSGMDIQIILKAIFDGMARDFGGSAEKMKGSWYGLQAITKSYIAELQRQVMSAGVLDALKQRLEDINELLGTWIKLNGQLIKQKVPEYIEKIETGLKKIWDMVSYDPAIIEWGIVGLLIGGKKGAVILGGLAHMATWVGLLSEAVDQAQAGLISLSDIATANFQELEALVKRARANMDLLSSHGPGGGKLPSIELPRTKSSLLSGKKGGDLGEGAKVPGLSDADMVKSLDEMFGIQQEHHKKLIDEWEDYEDAIKEAEEEKWKFLESLAQETQLEKILREKKEKELEEAEKQSEFMIELSERTANAMEQSFSDLYFDAMNAELTSFQDYFEAFGDSLKRMWADILGQMTKEWIMSFMKMGQSSGGGNASGLFSSIASAFSATGGGAGGGAAPTGGPAAGMGAVFTPHGMSAFGRGGVVNRPTIFPFANGTGLMGERGPEGILPLKRTASGELGVKSEETGAKSANVSFNIYAIDTQSGTEFLMKNAQSIAMAVNGELEGGNRGLIRNLRMVR